MVKYIVLDVDGTLTDGGIYIGSDGCESKRFCVKDGMGIRLARDRGIQFIIITGRKSACVEKRAEDLRIPYVFQGIADKLTLLQELMEEHSISPEQLGYIGDDVNDFEAMGLAGFTACPADAVSEIKQICRYVAKKPGGHGAVREILDHWQNGS